MEETKAVATIEKQSNLINVAEVGEIYTSLSVETAEDKKHVYNIMSGNGNGFRLKDQINKDIFIKDVFIEKIALTDEETGEVAECPRICLIEADGKYYTCVSKGIFNAITGIMQIFGKPPYVEPLKVTVKNVSRKERSFLTLEL